MPGDPATHSPPTNAAPCALVHPVAEHHRLPHAPSRCHHGALTPLVQQPPQCGSFCNDPSKVALDRGLCNRNPRSLLLPIVDVKRAEPLAQGLDHGMNPPLTWGNHRNNFIGPCTSDNETLLSQTLLYLSRLHHTLPGLIYLFVNNDAQRRKQHAHLTRVAAQDTYPSFQASTITVLYCRLRPTSAYVAFRRVP